MPGYCDCQCATCACNERPCKNTTHNLGGICTRCYRAGHEPDAGARLTERKTSTPSPQPYFTNPRGPRRHPKPRPHGE